MEMEKGLVSSHFMPVESEPQWRKTEATIRRETHFEVQRPPLAPCPLPMPCALCLLRSLLSICNAFSLPPQILTPFTAVLICNLLHKMYDPLPSESYFITSDLWLHHDPPHCSKDSCSFLPASQATHQQVPLTLLPKHSCFPPSAPTHPGLSHPHL